MNLALRSTVRDVVIVGAGPAGCAAAHLLGVAGFDVLVLERGKPGKDKPCGDAFLPGAVQQLAKYGISTERLRSLGGRAFHEIDLYFENAPFWQHSLRDSFGWLVPRAILDQEIRDVSARYATFHYETFVSQIRQDEQRTWTLTLEQKEIVLEIQCEAIILATGSSNTLATRWGIAGEPNVAASISVYAEGKAVPSPIFQFIKACRPGYGWIFPITETRVNIGVCTLEPKNKRLRKLAQDYVAASNVTPRGAWRGGAEALWSGKGHRWHHSSGLVSCGDAAGLVDPFNGEGITAAFVSGERAGFAIAEFLSQGKNSAALEEYSKWIATHFRGEYRKTVERQVWEALCSR